MFHFRELVDANRKEIASLLTAEHGKVLADALGEVARGLENIEFACGIPHLLKGGYSEQASTGVDVYSIRQPLGVVAGITPFNFPAMVPMWMFANAHRLRQHVRAQAEREGPVGVAVPRRAARSRPGCPTACFNVVQGDKVAVDRILEHPDIAAVSFVGSTPIARYIYETGTAQRQAGAGPRRGQEPHARAARRRPRHGRRRRRVGAGYGSAGERCMAISRRASPSSHVADALVAKHRRADPEARRSARAPSPTARWAR